MEAVSLTDSTQDRLVEQLKQGDRQAFQLLYHQYGDKIFSLCWRLLADRQLAEDATQEAFVRVWRNANSFRGDSSFKTWLYRLATNVALDLVRKQKRWWLPQNWHSEPEASEDLQDGLQLEALDRALLRLPEQQRLVFVLYAVEGYTHVEIAAMLNIASGTSKSHYHQARNNLKGWVNHE